MNNCGICVYKPEDGCSCDNWIEFPGCHKNVTGCDKCKESMISVSELQKLLVRIDNARTFSEGRTILKQSIQRMIG